MHPYTPVFVNGRWRGEGLADPPDDSVVGTPARRPSSVRRTSHIDATWAEGFGGPTRLDGRSRDLLTSADGDPVSLDDAGFRMELSPSGVITAFSASPPSVDLAPVVGTSAMKGFRARCN